MSGRSLPSGAVVESLESRRFLSGVVVPAVVLGPIATSPGTTAAGPSVVRGVGVTIEAEATDEFRGVVGYVAGYTGSLTGLSATISWGDGTPTSAGVLGLGADGRIAVGGVHTYAGAGHYPVTVVVTRQGPPGSAAPTVLVATIKSDAVVRPDDEGGVTLKVLAGKAFTAKVGSFDYTPPPTASPVALELSAMIDWGDGTKSPGKIKPTGADDYDVIGQHTYAVAGKYKVHVVVVAGYPKPTATAVAPPVIKVAEFDSTILALATPGPTT